jgi:L-aminopeptidase/D-esterase-like protein
VADVFEYRPGARNLITDVPGILVGNATHEAACTGSTLLLCTTCVATAVDVRGGGPGTRETDVLAPENLVGRADAILLTGGSVFGLAAADAVTCALSARGVGLQLHAGSRPLPIVPAAVLHDLGSGGDKDWGLEPPYRALGFAAVDAASDMFELGAVGAGRGARAGIKAGGLGSTSLDLGSGLKVGALMAVNPVGSVYMEDGTTFWAWPFEIDGEFGGARPKADIYARNPLPELGRLIAADKLRAGGNTSIGIVATSAQLSTAECKRLAMMAQDGIARAVRPAHTPFDGDVIFCVSTGAVDIGSGHARHMMIAALGSAIADCVARAIARGVYLAQ